ncbi:hypothetical protein BT96DRAFT_947777 [Gymnopus androsaceus JB14]|uniref:Uncharacterized protein n=1 Tax=Gymnopus androsaceus JB14 TaxID=1447944 RepID=A0A6A4GR19_9AGAR|nr:hypothetical protein BT96DRAFT_947777 [Gymnopus androsaceus JB14]
MSLEDLPLVPIACTVALCPTFEDKPLVTETFWDMLILSDSLNGAAAVPNVQLFQLLKAVTLQLVIDQATNVHHYPGIVVSFQYPSNTALGTVWVPNFSNGVNLEIFSFQSFPDTLEACMATPADPSFAKIVFASDTGHYITKLSLSNSPKVLSGLQSSYPHPHFILLLCSLPEPMCQPYPTPFLPFPNQDLFPELESQSFSPPDQTTGYPLPPSVPALNNVETFRGYLFHTQGQDTQVAIYLWEGYRKRPLWVGIQNHHNACKVLQQAGFTDPDLRSSSSKVFFELPNGRRLSMDNILTELDWHVDTFQKKYRLFESCSQYARLHYWSPQTLIPDYSHFRSHDDGGWDYLPKCLRAGERARRDSTPAAHMERNCSHVWPRGLRMVG